MLEWKLFEAEQPLAGPYIIISEDQQNLYPLEYRKVSEDCWKCFNFETNEIRFCEPPKGKYWIYSWHLYRHLNGMKVEAIQENTFLAQQKMNSPS